MADKKVEDLGLRISVVDLNESAWERASNPLKILNRPEYSCYEQNLRDCLKLVSVDVSSTPSNPHHCTTVYSLTVSRGLCNGGGNLHGGAVALIFDFCTSMTIHPVSKEGFWDFGHVSRTLNCTYIRPAREGDELLVESEVIHMGNRMALIRGVMKNKKTGKVCFTCEHNKASIGGAASL